MSDLVRRLIPAITAAVITLFAALMINGWNRAHVIDELPVEEAGGAERRVILLVVDRLGYRELYAGAGERLIRLLEQGALALMNVRSGRSGSESGYLSLGASARAVAGSEGGQAFNRQEQVEGVPAELLYRRLTGKHVLGEVIHLHAYSLQEKNSALDYPVTVGRLGQLLSDAGLTAAVVGNADTTAPGRGAVMIAMDRAGQVPLGTVGSSVLVEDPLFPFGKRADPVKTAAATGVYLERAHLVVVDFGDFSRLDQYWTQLAPAQRLAVFSAAMENLDQLLAGLLPLVKDNTVLVMVTPSTPCNRPGGSEELATLIWVSAGGPGPGLFFSPTTRRPGLITNTDLAPLIYSYLRRDSPSVSGGQSIGLISVADPPGLLARFSERVELIYRQRPPLLKSYILVMIITLLAALTGLALRLKFTMRLVLILDALMLVPLVLVVLPGLIRFPLPTVLLSGAVFAGSTLLLVLVLHPIKGKGRYLFYTVIGLATALVIIGDTLTGAQLQQASLLGYDPIAGARFYGVGNEYMGVLIGSTVLGTTALAAVADQGHRSLIVLTFLPFYGLIILLLAAPQFGANFGGTIAAAVAFGTAWAGMAGLISRWRDLGLTIIFFLLFAAAMLWVFNLFWQPPLPSHLGNFGQMVGSRGLEGLWETAQRKLSMNWRLIRYSIWSRAFLTLLGLLVVLFFYPLGLLRRLKEEQPDLLNVAAAAVTGSTAALLLNDSGIVAAATILLYAAPPVLIAIMSRVLDAGFKTGGQDNPAR
ncbi:MAG: hypothetical protein AB1767_03195 [Bacillota bacterium]